MSKTLVIIRHAKSDWADASLSDRERPLNGRGEKDAPAAGKRLKARELFPDLIICSDAKRTKQTARRIADVLDYPHKQIMKTADLYLAPVENIQEVIQSAEDEVDTLFLIGHNPGLTEFVNGLTPAFRTDNIPTCGVVGIRVDVSRWKDFEQATKEVFLFEYPKQFHDS